MLSGNSDSEVVAFRLFIRDPSEDTRITLGKVAGGKDGPCVRVERRSGRASRRRQRWSWALRGGMTPAVQAGWVGKSTCTYNSV